MARPKTMLLSSMCRSCRSAYTPPRRGLSTTSTSLDSENPRSRLAQRVGIQNYEDNSSQKPVDALSEFEKATQPSTPRLRPQPAFSNNSLRNAMGRDARPIRSEDDPSSSSFPTSNNDADDRYRDEPYHINVYSHRHNTVITFTTPQRNPILSLSCGNLGLKNAQKSSYDASFQLAAYTFRKMAEKQWKLGGKDAKTGAWLTLSSIHKPGWSGTTGNGIEVIMRGYGPGREAFQKALLGTEGRMIKPLIAKVTDGTRLKFGGTRSPQVRRLG